jgi:hypothetical protein
MKKIVAVTLLAVIMVFGANWVRAPKVEAVPVVGDPAVGNLPQPPPPAGQDQTVIYTVPDLRSIAGSPGKSIVFADDGQNVAVIYGRFSGDPTNFMQTYVSYSTNRGNSWTHYGPLSTFDSRRIYPGLDAENNWLDPSDMRVHFAWHQAAQISGSYDSSPAFYSKEVSYPDGLITAAFRLPNSGTWDVWEPCVTVKDSFVIIIAVNNGTFLTTYDGYIWRSTDYGETWDDGRIFFPGPREWMAGPHFRFGSDGYIFFLWNRAEESNPALYWPYYCESSDYGVTWTQPQLIWQGTPPYPDMSDVKGWWYTYDCAVVNDTPVAAVKLGPADWDNGELWVYRPTSGSPGNWQFTGTCLVGDPDSTAPQTIERYAQVAKDDRGDIFIGYQAVFETSTDTAIDCAMFVRPYNRNVWLDWGMITFGRYGAWTDQAQLEFAHNAPIVGTSPDDSAVISFIWTNAQTYPITGDLYYENVAVPIIWIDTASPHIAESNCPVMNKTNLTVTPNPFRNSVKFALVGANGGSPVRVSIYDVSGKLVRELRTTVDGPRTTLFWDGRNTNGTLVNSGIYFYNLSSRTGNVKGKMTLSR